jgi:hypothetical protein
MKKWAVGVLATQEGVNPVFTNEIVSLGDKSDRIDATNAVLKMPKYFGKRIEIVKIKEVM